MMLRLDAFGRCRIGAHALCLFCWFHTGDKLRSGISCSWRAMSATRPRSSTMIAWASVSDDSRCYTMITVRPSAILLRLVRMIASLSRSSELVASSKISMHGLVRGARAIAMR